LKFYGLTTKFGYFGLQRHSTWNGCSTYENELNLHDQEWHTYVQDQTCVICLQARRKVGYLVSALIANFNVSVYQMEAHVNSPSFSAGGSSSPSFHATVSGLCHTSAHQPPDCIVMQVLDPLSIYLKDFPQLLSFVQHGASVHLCACKKCARDLVLRGSSACPVCR
jgi:hypothetical protein